MIENKTMKKLLVFLLASSPVFANELSLYFIPSPKGVDWSSPRASLVSGLKNKLSFAPHFMGHAWVELKCGDRHELTGMTDVDPDYFSKVIFEQRGMGVFFHSFPGRMENKEDIEKELQDYFKNGGMNFVRFNLNPPQCARALQYLDEYRKNNVGRYYGLANRPRHGEGSGCSAFAVSFPDVLDILDQEMKEAWSYHIKIPHELAGPPIKDETVNVFKILGRDTWASDNEKHIPLSFWSPDKMYTWVQEKSNQKRSGYTVTKIENVQGVVFDKSHFPAPEGPIWLQQLDPANKKQTLILEKSSRPPKKNIPAP